MRIASQNTGLRTCPQSHHLLSMNIEGNIQSHTFTSLTMSLRSKWVHSTQFSIDFRLQTIFQTETETLQCYKDVLRARDYDNIWIYMVR